MYAMTTNAQERAVPELVLAWRLKMALAYGDVSREDMAEHLGVSPSSISRWCNDDKGEKDPPKRAYLAQWALITGVDLDWLQTGQADTASPDPDPNDGQREERVRRLTSSKRSRTLHDTPTRSYSDPAVAAA